MMKISPFLILLLPCIAQCYSMFDFSGDKSNSNEPLVKAEQPILSAVSSVSSSTNKKHYDDAQFGQMHSLLPPTESTLSTGLFHTCAITYRAGVDQDTCGKSNKPCGPVKCWGHNERGQSTPPPGVMFTQISAGGFFTCGIKVDGRIACWGDIDHPPTSIESLSHEEISNVKYARRLQQEQPHLHGNGYYFQVSSGNKHACAISRDYEVHCWGRNDYGESSPPSGKFVQISAGHSFTCGIQSNGAAKCWGKNDAGQSTPPSYPQNIFEQVSASIGGDHACGILKGADGDVRCWGSNSRGQSEDQNGKFLHVSAGARTSCGIRVDDEVTADSTSIHCWGNRANTLLDHFEAKQSSKKDHQHNHNQIVLGQDHACATAMKSESSLGSNVHPTLECWWMAGSNFDAHQVPVGIQLVV